MPSALYLIPVTLGETSIEQVLPTYNHEVIMGIRHFVVENIRSARRFLRQTDKAFPIDDCPVGVISEAGCPAVADPGADIVSIAQRKGLKVVPLVGPNSMIMAVMSSGLGGQSFAFNGYLPVEPADRAKKLKMLETRAWTEGQTQLFIETPFRNQKMFESLLTALRPQTRLCIAAGITTADEYIRTLPIAKWKSTKLPDLSKVPAIFLINK